MHYFQNNEITPNFSLKIRAGYTRYPALLPNNVGLVTRPLCLPFSIGNFSLESLTKTGFRLVTIGLATMNSAS